MPESSIELKVPAQPEAVRVLRSVATAVAAGLDFGYDRIEDLGLAISEASAFLLAPAAGDLVCRLGYDARHVRLALSAPGEHGAWDGSLEQVVVESVATDVTVDPDAVHFTITR